MIDEIKPHLRHNFVVNLIDGGFFGLALGFASFSTIIPLFVRSFTDSAILIGLIPGIHAVGWQLPQLLLANRLANQVKFKPTVLFLTIQERLPFLGLAVVAWFLPVIGTRLGLTLTFVLLIWQGLGAGFTANPWQSMIAKIIPSDTRGTFFGVQAASANLLASLSAVLAGFALEKYAFPGNYALCFLLAFAALILSWWFLALTREPVSKAPDIISTSTMFWSGTFAILKRDYNFRWFLVGRTLFSFASMGSAFFTVYAVHHYGVGEAVIGIMTGVLMGTQIVANPLMGWLSDRWSHRYIIEIGLLAVTGSCLLAWWAPHANWYYLIFILVGIGNVSLWTVSLALTLEFGKENERPAYIGLANTLVAPSTILAPLFGGWLADFADYPATFLASAIAGMITLAVFQFLVRDPKRLQNRVTG